MEIARPKKGEKTHRQLEWLKSQVRPVMQQLMLAGLDEEVAKALNTNLTDRNIVKGDIQNDE